jgi:hypothetical protein
VRALRRLFGFIALLGVAFLGIVVYRRRFAGRHERVDLYYEDGTLVTLTEESSGSENLLPLARELIAAARG